MTGFQAQMEGVAGSALPTYNQVLLDTTHKTLDFVTAQITAFTEFMQSQKEFTDVMKYLGRVLQSVPGGGFVQAGAQKLVDAADFIGHGAPEKISAMGIDVLANPDNPGPTPSAAEGGVLSGPATGFPATLHGTEAVVPLPDGKTIPIEVSTTAPITTTQPTETQQASADNKALTDAINNQTGILNQILASMNKNNTLTTGILQASM